MIKILFGLAGLFGLYRLFRTTDVLALIILGLQIISIVMIFIVETPFKSIGSWLFMLSLFLAIIYALVKEDVKISKRVLIIFPASLALFIHFVPVMHHNELRMLAFAMIIPIGAFVILVARDFRNYRNELGFLTIILIDGVSQIVEGLQFYRHY